MTPDNFRLFGFATGDYMCRCLACRAEFTGDKRAITCLSCAITQAETAPAQGVAPAAEALGTVRDALEFYASNWDWHPGDGEYNGIEPGSPPTYYEAAPNAEMREDGGERAFKALAALGSKPPHSTFSPAQGVGTQGQGDEPFIIRSYLPAAPREAG